MRALPLLLCCLLIAPAAAANPFAEGPVTWRGEGIFRRAIDAAPEGMRCRSETEPRENGFFLSGRCASAASSATLELDVAFDGGTAILHLTTSLQDQPLTLSGFHTEEGLAAEAAQTVLIDEVEAEFRLQINYTEEGGFVLTEFVTPVAGGERRELVQIRFER